MKILLSDIRLNKKLSLEDLADISGVSKSTLQRIEKGKTSPTMLTMEKLAKALDMKINDLFESDYK